MEDLKIIWEKEKLKNGKKILEIKRGTTGRSFYQGRDWFNCDCGTEGIILEDDIDEFEDKNKIKSYYHTISLAFWEHGKNKNTTLGFKERLRYCWNIIKKGIPYSDAVLLTSSEAEKLARNILARIEFVKEQEKINNEKS